MWIGDRKAIVGGRARNRLRALLHSAVDRVWQATLQPKGDFCFSLGGSPQKGSLSAVVYPERLWQQEPLWSKLRCLLLRKWEPTNEARQREAEAVFVGDIFGTADDFGPHLLDLMNQHFAQQFDLSALTVHDATRADALQTYTVATRERLRRIESSNPPLNLQLYRRCPAICGLVFPMVIKIPVIAFRHFVDVHTAFAFNEIRKSGHPESEAIIALLYEVLFLQQKIAVALSDYLLKMHHAFHEKRDSILLLEEVDAMMSADLLFPYLKASVEKTLALIAATHSIAGLESKKTHKAKLDALQRGLPDQNKQTPYAKLLLEFVSPENLEDLNNYRSGLLHKKGIADLQPHNYAGVSATALPFLKLFGVLHEQHAKNTAALLSALAMLTDELVRRDEQAGKLPVMPQFGPKRGR